MKNLILNQFKRWCYFPQQRGKKYLSTRMAENGEGGRLQTTDYRLQTIKIPTPLLEVGELWINLYPIKYNLLVISWHATICLLLCIRRSHRKITSVPFLVIAKSFWSVIKFFVTIFKDLTFWVEKFNFKPVQTLMLFSATTGEKIFVN